MVFYIFYGVTLLGVLLYLYFNGKRIELFNFFILLFFLFFGPAFFDYNNIIDSISITEVQCLILTILFLFLGKGGCKILRIQLKDERIKTYNLRKTPFFILYGFTFLLFFFALFKFGGINNLLVVLNSGGTLTPMELKELRFDFKVEGLVGSLIGYFEVIGILLSMLMFAYSIEYKQRLLLITNIIFCLMIVLWGASTLHKAIAFFYILQLAIFFYLFKKIAWEWNIKVITRAILLILVLIVPIYLFLTNSEDAFDATNQVINRVTEEPNRVLREYFIFWPNVLPHRLGLNIRFIHSFLGEGEFEPAYKTIIYQYFSPNTPMLGTWPTIFIADAWVDFSYFGVILFSFLVGLTLSLLDLFIANNKSIYSAALFCANIGALFGLIENSFMTILLTGGLGTLPILFICLVKKEIIID